MRDLLVRFLAPLFRLQIRFVDGGGRRVQRLQVALLVGILLVVSSGGAVQAQSVDCSQRRAEAERAYFQADFQQAVDLLEPCLNGAAKDERAVEVYRLAAFAHLGAGDTDEARLVVEDLLDVRPSYTPNPDDDRPDYVALVEDVKASRQPPTEKTASTRNRRWVRWVIGSVVVVATAAVISVVAGGGGDNGDNDDDFDDDFDN